MKWLSLLFLLFSAGIAALCLEPAGETIPFRAASSLRGESSSTEVFSFPGAPFIKIHLDRLELGPREELTVSDGVRRIWTLAGPYSGDTWLPSVTTGSVHLTLTSASPPGSASFFVDKIGVGYAPSAEPESVCGIDDRKNAACYGDELRSPALAVGKMIFSDGIYWYYCTGSLISAQGHFLTNNHCIMDQATASTLEVWWKYEASSCGDYSGLFEYTTSGATLLATDPSLDYSLLRIDDAELYHRYGYLQIADRPASLGETIWIPQHGGGQVKRFAVESDLDGGGYATVVDESIGGFIAESDIGYWADTEGGSSGSPVLDNYNKILALHHFGTGGYQCDSGYMNQGVKMSLIYPDISPYLQQPVPLRVAAFATPSQGTAPLSIRLKASTSGGAPPYSHHWDFGDGSSGGGEDTSHTYYTAGSFTALVTVTDSGSESVTASVAVKVEEPPFSVSALAVPSSGEAPLAVTLTASTEGGAAPYSFSWDFGDGDHGSGETISHTYRSPGIYTASVAALDGTGTSAGACASVTVAVKNPTITRISKISNPFRLAIRGTDFQAGFLVYIGDDPAPWPDSSFKNPTKLVLRRGAILKRNFPKGVPVTIRLVNPDGGFALFDFTR